MAEAETKKAAVKVEKRSVPAAAAPLWGPGLELWQSFQNEMERAFERFTKTFALPGATRRLFDVEPFGRLETAIGATLPVVDVVETEKGYQIKAEMPGMDDKDVEISLSGDMLTIRGEKSESKEEKEGEYHVSERRYGSFQRSFSLPDGIDRDHIAAKFDKGVLMVTLPKTQEAVKQQKKIPISK